MVICVFMTPVEGLFIPKGVVSNKAENCFLTESLKNICFPFLSAFDTLKIQFSVIQNDTT